VQLQLDAAALEDQFHTGSRQWKALRPAMNFKPTTIFYFEHTSN